MSERIHLQESMYARAADRSLFEQARSYAYEYMDGVFERAVFPTPQALANLKYFDEPLPAAPGDPAAMLRMLHEYDVRMHITEGS